ncbi:cupin domain-containing protein [Pseudonocardia broussonetiae]|uniref:Cupin domain-containing protein n=1 Tax=Pseudonocardia broussonetiae TaxID=2736640 RepID=A0A6M6JKF8_9PSEU|nr:cupin domain-containing protein [Pseudonocardia broussonetiae]QJY47530.1 cupin domain-containing protein [Pseudonocardia broussonetiae]
MSFHLPDGAGDAWWFLDTRMTVKADRTSTGGAYTLLEFAAPQGFGPPRHVHGAEDEAFLVLTGALHVECGDDAFDVAPGGFVFLPRAVPHAFVVSSAEPVRALQITSPGGFEEFVAAVGSRADGPGLPPPSVPDVPRLAAASARFGTDIVGPPLGVAAPPR